MLAEAFSHFKFLEVDCLFKFLLCFKAFTLIQEEVKIDKPESIHYVFAGLAPLSVRIVEMMFNAGGFNRMKDQLKLIPGA